MQILNVIGIDWSERMLINKLYIDQLDQGGDRKCEDGRGVNNNAVCLRLYFTCSVNTLPRNFLKVCEISK